MILTGDNVDPLTIYIDIVDNSLSRKWLSALNYLLVNNYHLEKNYCFHGFVESRRNGWFILEKINESIAAINRANLGYYIDEHFTMSNCITDQPNGNRIVGRNIVHQKFNKLHRYFEDLQGVSGHMSKYYTNADKITKWHIRQLNNLCHEFESWALSYRKELEAPDWRRPSQLMCWLNAPRFTLDENDYDLFGIETINRPLGGVFVGVNKAIGKHHWEVFNDEGRDSRINELTTSTLRSQTVAAGDFDIEWGMNPSQFIWQQQKLQEFSDWLVANNFDPNDKSLTIGHPQVGQVDIIRSFCTTNINTIWSALSFRLNVAQIQTSLASAVFDYSWCDDNYQSIQVKNLWP